jgi:excisionase family DNA binding protein
MKKLISIKRLAEQLDTTPYTLYDWVRKRKIPYYKVNGSLKFDIDEIDKWIEEGKQEIYK